MRSYSARGEYVGQLLGIADDHGTLRGGERHDAAGDIDLRRFVHNEAVVQVAGKTGACGICRA